MALQHVQSTAISEAAWQSIPSQLSNHPGPLEGAAPTLRSQFSCSARTRAQVPALGRLLLRQQLSAELDKHPR